MKFAPVFLLQNGSMASSTHSNGQELSDLVFGSIQAEWSGASASGSLKLQISNDNVPVSQVVNGDPAANVVNWSDYTGSITPVAGPGNWTWNLFPMGYKWIRVVYTAASGTGSLTVEFMGKG
jgi:hypothetical protein